MKAPGLFGLFSWNLCDVFFFSHGGFIFFRGNDERYCKLRCAKTHPRCGKERSFGPVWGFTSWPRVYHSTVLKANGMDKITTQNDGFLEKVVKRDPLKKMGGHFLGINSFDFWGVTRERFIGFITPSWGRGSRRFTPLIIVDPLLGSMIF